MSGPMKPAEALERSLVHVLRRRMEDSADRPWLIFPDRVLTYGEADALSNRFANGMRRHGIEPGETLLVMLPDGPDLVMSWLACAKLGVIEVPVNTAYRGDILSHIIQDSRATSMLVSSAYIERLRELGGGLGKVERCFVSAQDRYSSPVLPATLLDLDSMVSDDDRPPGMAIGPNDLKAIMYTSGTSGRSKGVMV